MTALPNRKPKGIPTGGEFANKTTSESVLVIEPTGVTSDITSTGGPTVDGAPDLKPINPDDADYKWYLGMDKILDLQPITSAFDEIAKRGGKTTSMENQTFIFGRMNDAQRALVNRFEELAEECYTQNDSMEETLYVDEYVDGLPIYGEIEVETWSVDVPASRFEPGYSRDSGCEFRVLNYSDCPPWIKETSSGSIVIQDPRKHVKAVTDYVNRRNDGP